MKHGILEGTKASDETARETNERLYFVWIFREMSTEKVICSEWG
ncbi:hypothetical protein ACFL9T_19095 [Thermodesulfobacteriota bacterium]